MSEVDLFVLGGGSGGVACARRAASHGVKVALAEESRLGGTCVIRGCVPKKLMRYGAHFADYFRIARAYGWDSAEPRLDFQRLLQARNQEIARLNGIYRGMLDKSGVRVLEGHGRLVGRDDARFVVEVGHERVLARNVLVAVGGRPVMPELEGIEHAVTSDHLLEDVYPLPARVAIIGGGYIGLELATILAGVGAETHLVMRQALPLRGFDEDVRQDLAARLGERGLKLHPETTPSRIVKTAGGLRLETSAGVLDVDMVVMATGRQPVARTAGLGLRELGVQLDGLGRIEVDEAYESAAPGLFAVGDCSSHTVGDDKGGAFDLTPIAIAEGRAIAERLFNANPQSVDYRFVPTAVFSIPEAAAVGMTEADARATGHDVTIFRTRFRPMLHTLAQGSERTMMKLVVDRSTDRVLGVHMVGDDAAEIIQGLAVALTSGATKAEFDATVALHPTAAEEFVTLYQPVG